MRNRPQQSEVAQSKKNSFRGTKNRLEEQKIIPREQPEIDQCPLFKEIVQSNSKTFRGRSNYPEQQKMVQSNKKSFSEIGTRPG